MTGLSSGPSTEPIRTISDVYGPGNHYSSSTSDLSALSDHPAPKLGSSSKPNGLKRARESEASVDDTMYDIVYVKKPKLETEKGIYCHQ